MDFPGGAAVVAKHLRQAGAEVTFSTVLGDDALKDFVLEGSGSERRRMPRVHRSDPADHPKERVHRRRLPMLKVDRLDNRPISEHERERAQGRAGQTPGGCRGLQRFPPRHLQRYTIPQLTEAMPAGATRVADSQVSNRWGNILEFQGFDLITPNEREARFALGDQDSVVRPLALELYKRAGCK